MFIFVYKILNKYLQNMKSIEELINEGYDKSIDKVIKQINDEIVDLESENKIKDLKELINNLLDNITNNGEDHTVISIISNYID